MREPIAGGTDEHKVNENVPFFAQLLNNFGAERAIQPDVFD
jgi:hypothetical protein